MKKHLFIILYWFLSLTWGIIASAIGAVVSLFAIIFGGKPHKNGCTIIIEIGGHWGGLELGCFALCSNYSKNYPSYYEEIRRHEFGHSIQNIILGPFFIFIVSIPSAIRYWYERISNSHGKYFPPDWYDSIWFEGTATRVGTRIINWLESK